MNLFITKHALQRMYERSINEEEVEYAIENGVIINEYVDDKPYPSILVHCLINAQPLHVVYSYDNSNLKEKNCLVITVYRPSIEEWNIDYVTRRVEK